MTHVIVNAHTACSSGAIAELSLVLANISIIITQPKDVDTHVVLEGKRELIASVPSAVLSY